MNTSEERVAIKRDPSKLPPGTIFWTGGEAGIFGPHLKVTPGDHRVITLSHGGRARYSGRVLVGDIEFVDEKKGEEGVFDDVSSGECFAIEGEDGFFIASRANNIVSSLEAYHLETGERQSVEKDDKIIHVDLKWEFQ